MKKLLYFLLLIPFVLLQSCLKDQEDVFDATASARLDAAIKEYKTILAGAANGWVMEYYPEAYQAYGGINILVKFSDDGLATITNEMGYVAPELDMVTSTYKVIAETGAVLTFDTYNPYIHIFADPNPNLTGSIDGFQGDYEFVIVSATPERIEMRGKKSQNTIIMTALNATTTWEGYLADVGNVIEESAAPSYALYVGTEMISTAIDGMKFTFSWAENEKIQTANVSFIYTSVGIKFYKPFVYKGKSMQNFTLNIAAETLECTDGTDAKLAMVFPPLNEVFSGTMSKWYFDYSTLNSTMKTMWDKAKLECLLNEGETLDRIYVGYFSGEKGQGTSIGFITDAYQAVTSVDLVAVAGTEDQITITRTNLDYLNYSFYVPYFDPVANFIAQGSPYKMVADNDKKPTSITFTSLANPNATFILSK